jgi:hypothetical protein
MVLWPALLAMPWHKWAISSGRVLLLLGPMMAFASGRMNARAMGPNILKGQIELAHENDSPEQLKRNAARRYADRLFWVGIVLTALGVILQTLGIIV